MSISITQEERDALYNRIVVRLNGIDSVSRAVEEEDWEAAQELGQEFADLLHLVCADLGWGEEAKASFALTTPPDVLDRAALALLDLATFDKAHYDDEVQEAKESSDEAGYLIATCERIHSQLKR